MAKLRLKVRSRDLAAVCLHRHKGSVGVLGADIHNHIATHSAPVRWSGMNPFRDPLIVLLIITAAATTFFFVLMTA
jgi:hypothetical protein